MKNIKTIAMTAIFVATLTSCNAELIKESAKHVLIADGISAAIRTNWNENDFGVMDAKLQGKNSIYISYNLQDKDGDEKQGQHQDLQSYSTCKGIAKAINNKYQCFVAKRDYEQFGKKDFYQDIKEGGLSIVITKPVNNGIIGGTNYQLDVFDTTTNTKLDSFRSNALYQNSVITSNEIAEYVAEYIYYLDKAVQ